jgi:phage antirepressor YoqD-like protein
MTNNKQQTEINAVEYLAKVNQFAKENNTGKPRQQTAIEWLFNNVYMAHSELSEKLKQAKEMEKERIETAFNSGYNNGGLDTCLTPKQYYNETYGGGER